MSSIPNTAMPHAVAQPEAEESKTSFLLDGAQRLADKARETPIASIAIGAGVVAAATVATVALSRRSGKSSRTSSAAKPASRARKTKG